MTDLIIDKQEESDIYEFIMLIPEEHREVVILEMEG
jgi:hypothetical protein